MRFTLSTRAGGRAAGRSALTLGLLDQPRGTVLAVSEVRAALVNCDGRMRVRIDKPGQRVPARQFLRIARSRDRTLAREAVQEYP